MHVFISLYKPDSEEKMIHCQVFFYLIAVVTVTQQRVIYVLPDGPESQCPVSDCSSLTAVMSDELLLNNVSDTTITLLPGVHVLRNNSLFLFENASNFAFRSANSNSSATIMCNGTIGFLFQQITDLLISGITFENCGAFGNMQTNDLYTQHPFTLSIMNSSTITITNVSVKNSKGYGLLAVSVCDFRLSESNLIQNEINFYVFIKGIEEMCLGHTNITIVNTKFKAGNPSTFSTLDQSHVTFSQLSDTLISPYFQIYKSMKCRIALSNVEVNEDSRLSCLDVLFHGVTISLHPGKTLLFKMNRYKVTFPIFRLKPITLRNVLFKNTSISLVQDIDREFVEVTLSEAYFQNTCVHITIPLINFENTIIFQDSPCGIVLQRKLVIQGSVMMYKNNKGGIQIQNIENVLIRYSQLFITNNYLPNEDAPLVSLYSNLIIEESEIILENNSGRRCGGVLLLKSNITFMGMSSTLKFYNNSGSRGGALALYGLSVLILKGTNMKFLGNHASIVGGAIFVEDSDYVHHTSVVDKVYSVFYQSDCSLGNSTLYFSNNTALQAGSAIYGGWILETACIFFIYAKASKSTEGDLSLISSNPIRICMCNNVSKPDCNTNKVTSELIPGQSFEIEAVAVGQTFGIVPSIVQADLSSDSITTIEQLQYVQTVQRQCTKLTFTIATSGSTVTLNLTSNIESVPFDALKSLSESGTRLDLLYTQFQINFHVMKCPPGFFFNKIATKCECQQTLIDHGIHCDLQTLKVMRTNQKWIQATDEHLLQTQEWGIIVHEHCPFDYCIHVPVNGVQPLNLVYPDEQCAFHRSGTLCGACQTNFSHTLGTSKCKQCKTPWIALIIPLTALAGVALVIGIMMLNLTVSVGTINGLIFYANIIRANHAIFFPYQASNSFLSIFIAWLNLDIGIEVYVSMMDLMLTPTFGFNSYFLSTFGLWSYLSL